MSSNVGATNVLAASWLNLCLFSVEVVTASYFISFCRPLNAQKWLVYAALVADTWGTLNYCVISYFILIGVPNSPPEKFESAISSFAVATATGTLSTSLSAVIGQMFFAYRYWTISKSRLVTGMLGTLMLVHVGFGLAATISIITFKNPTQDQYSTSFGRHAAVIFISVSAGVDIITALAMVWALSHYRNSDFKLATHNIIRRVALYAVACGGMTATCAIILSILLATSPTNAAYFSATLGRVYSLTIIINFILLKRQNLAEIRRSNERDTLPNLTSGQFGGATNSIVAFASQTGSTSLHQTSKIQLQPMGLSENSASDGSQDGPSATKSLPVGLGDHRTS